MYWENDCVERRRGPEEKAVFTCTVCTVLLVSLLYFHGSKHQNMGEVDFRVTEVAFLCKLDEIAT